jgi:hypothetical protein
LDVVEMQTRHIRNPEASPEERIDQQQSTVTNGTNQAGVPVVELAARGTDGGNLRLGKRHRSAGIISWVFNARSWVRLYPSTVKAEIEKRADSLPFLADGSGGEVHRGDKVENVVSGNVCHVSTIKLADGTLVYFDGRSGNAAESAISDVGLAAKIERVLIAGGVDTTAWRGADGLVDEINGGTPVSGFKASADANTTGVAINPDGAIAGLEG